MGYSARGTTLLGALPSAVDDKNISCFFIYKYIKMFFYFKKKHF